MAEVFAAPVLNTIFIIKEALVGMVNPLHVGITVVTTAAYSLICVPIAVRVFRRGDVLFRE